MSRNLRRALTDKPGDTDAEGHAVKGKGVTEDRPESDVVIGGEQPGPPIPASCGSDQADSVGSQAAPASRSSRVIRVRPCTSAVAASR